MSNVLDFSFERLRRDRGQHLGTNSEGREVYLFAGIGIIDGRPRRYRIWAGSAADAEDRAAAVWAALRNLSGRDRHG